MELAFSGHSLPVQRPMPSNAVSHLPCVPLLVVVCVVRQGVAGDVWVLVPVASSRLFDSRTTGASSRLLDRGGDFEAWGVRHIMVKARGRAVVDALERVRRDVGAAVARLVGVLVVRAAVGVGGRGGRWSAGRGTPR